MSSVKLKTTDNNKTSSYPVEVAIKLLEWKPKLYQLDDDKFELIKGELRRQSNKGENKKLSA